MKKTIKIKEKSSGITLISLAITIVVLLILAGISIAAVTGENGLIKNASDAKEENQISEEKEKIGLSVVSAMRNDKYGDLEKINLQWAINEVAGENKGKVYEDGDNFLILFNSKRIYTIDKDGNIIDMQKDFENPTKKFAIQLEDESYGTEEKQYEINCIEDLVELSYKVNGIEVIDGELTEGTNYKSFQNKYIILNRNLSFTSELCYENSETTEYGDINGNGEVEKILIELTTGKGWIPIGRSNRTFNGNFDGNYKEIRKIYINNEEDAFNFGLFGAVFSNMSNNTIKNLGVLGNFYCNNIVGGIIGNQKTSNVEYKTSINNCYFNGSIENINTSKSTGGIVGSVYNASINNCYTKGIIKGNNKDAGTSSVGGIVSYGKSATIQNSYNEAKVIGYSRVGGICGSSAEEINNCYNTGDIEGEVNVGGILGFDVDKISKCYNTGTIKANNRCGGIAGQIYSGSNQEIKQCYNLGIVKGQSATGGILGYISATNYLTVEECCNFKEITGTTYTAGIIGYISGYYTKILNCYNMGEINGTQVAGIARGTSGHTKTAKIVSCYNTGNLNATNKFGICHNNGVVYNSYYLETCGATDSIEMSRSEGDLKTLASTLDKSFTIDDEQNTVTINEESQEIWTEDTNNINKGYPILKWQ